MLGVPMRAFIVWVAALLATAIHFAAQPAEARVREVVVPVRGMTCALCTRGVEESIRRLRGVGTANADLKSGRVRVTVGKEHPLDLEEVKRSVAEAGFEVDGECDLVATGRFALAEERRLTLAIDGTPLRYRVLENNQTLLLFRAHPDLDGPFTVRFRLHDDPRWDPPAISLRAIEPRGGSR